MEIPAGQTRWVRETTALTRQKTTEPQPNTMVLKCREPVWYDSFEGLSLSQQAFGSVEHHSLWFRRNTPVSPHSMRITPTFVKLWPRDGLGFSPHHPSAQIPWVSLQLRSSLLIQDFFPMHESTTGSESVAEPEMLPKRIQPHTLWSPTVTAEPLPPSDSAARTLKRHRKLWDEKRFGIPRTYYIQKKQDSLCFPGKTGGEIRSGC